MTEKELQKAASNGNMEKLKLILQAKPGLIEEADESGMTALHIAAKEGHADIVSFLLGKNAGANSRNKWLQTPLHYAASKGQHEAAVSLIEGGARVDIRDRDGQTPLHLACSSGSLAVTELLIRHGADSRVCDNYNVSALHEAVSGRCRGGNQSSYRGRRRCRRHKQIRRDTSAYCRTEGKHGDREDAAER